MFVQFIPADFNHGRTQAKSWLKNKYKLYAQWVRTTDFNLSMVLGFKLKDLMLNYILQSSHFVTISISKLENIKEFNMQLKVGLIQS